MDSVRSSVVEAIRQGAPLYNLGQQEACLQLYQRTADDIVKAGTAPSIVREALREALVHAAQEARVSSAAWVLRDCFDEILDGRLEAHASLSQLPEGAKEADVFDFKLGMPPHPRWFSMDDSIMGGMSTSSLSWDPDVGAAVFQGLLTTANNGGFASVRSEPWGGYAMFQKSKGIRLEVNGDGRTYKLSAKTDDGYDGIMYQHDFEAPGDGQWQNVDLAFEAFKPNFRGRVVADRPLLTGARVRQLGLMVSKFSDQGGLTRGFRTGNFRLAIRSIRGIL